MKMNIKSKAGSSFNYLSVYLHGKRVMSNNKQIMIIYKITYTKIMIQPYLIQTVHFFKELINLKKINLFVNYVSK